MPHPSLTVSQGKNYNGNLREIDGDFIKYVKILIPSILAPERLIVKKINGQKIRAQDLVQYLQTYVNIFHSDELPQPETILMVGQF